MASKHYENLGPIYLTQAKYEALKTAGTIESGREYNIVDYKNLVKKHLIYASNNITSAGVVQTYEDIKNLITSDNYNVFITDGSNSYDFDYYDSSENIIWFSTTAINAELPYIYKISINSTNTVNKEEYKLALASKSLPASPEEDDVYTLEANVVDGKVSYNWSNSILVTVSEGYSIDATITNLTADVNNPLHVSDVATLIYYADGVDYATPKESLVIIGAKGTYTRISETECSINLTDPESDVSFSLEALEKLKAPTSLTSSGTNVLFTPASNTSYYRVYADDTVIGEAPAELVVYNITANLIGLTASESNPTAIKDGETVTLVFTADGEVFKTPETISTITGATGIYNRESDMVCSVVLSDATGPVSFEINGVLLKNYLCFTAEEDTNIAFTLNGSLDTLPVLYYSNDRHSWSSYTFGDNISLSSGKSCYWRGENASFSQGQYSCITFTSTGKVAAIGSIMSLLDNSGITLVIPSSYCFANLFDGCTSLTSAPELPATNLTVNCYYRMFGGCTSLTSAPKLPATTLAASCYYGMFDGCTSLTTTPKLSAISLFDSCYMSMFYGCTSLVTVPELPAISLVDFCYNNMFNGCTKIKLSTTQSGEYVNEYRIPNSGTGTTATGALYRMFTSTGGTFTGTPTINTTYYTSNEVIG